MWRPPSAIAAAKSGWNGRNRLRRMRRAFARAPSRRPRAHPASETRPDPDGSHDRFRPRRRWKATAPRCRRAGTNSCRSPRRTAVPTLGSRWVRPRRRHSGREEITALSKAEHGLKPHRQATTNRSRGKGVLKFQGQRHLERLSRKGEVLSHAIKTGMERERSARRIKGEAPCPLWRPANRVGCARDPWPCRP